MKKDGGQMIYYLKVNSHGIISSANPQILLGKVGENKSTAIQISIPITNNDYDLSSSNLNIHFILPSDSFLTAALTPIKIEDEQVIYYYEILSSLLTMSGDGSMSFVITIPDETGFTWKTNNIPIVIDSDTTTSQPVSEEAPNWLSDLNSSLKVVHTIPATSTSIGIKNSISFDEDYVYICTATNTWIRIAVSAW